MTTNRRRSAVAGTALALSACFLASVAQPASGDDSEQVLTIDHFVRVRSTVPAIAWQPAQIYVR